MPSATEYKLPPEMPAKPVRQLLGGAALFMAFALAAGLLSVSRQHDVTPHVLWLTAGVFVAAVAVGMYIGIQNQRRAWTSFRLTVTPDELTRRIAGLPDLVVRRHEVTKLRHRPGYGVHVCTADRHRTLFISSQLQGYAEVLDVLTAWAPTEEPVPRSARWLPWLAGASAVLLTNVATVATEPSIAIAANLTTAVGLSVCVYLLLRSPHLQRWQKVCMLLMVPTIIGMVVRALSVIWA